MQHAVGAATPVRPDHPRGGITVTFNLTSDQPLQLSPLWTVAGRTLQLVHLGPDATFNLTTEHCFVKVITGHLSDPERGCLARPFAVRTTRVTSRQLTSSNSGALFMLMTVDDVSANINAMQQVQFQGEFSENLVWQSFAERFGAVMDYFNDLDCHMMDGIHVHDEQDEEIVYINFWTCGKGVDLTTHNHAQPPSPAAPAFAEVHWVLNNGTGSGGMYETAEPGAPLRIRHLLTLGDEHGPYYDLDDAGYPVMRDNGAVQYPWHGWQGGYDESAEQSYDFVAAFEINPARLDPVAPD